MQYAFDEFWSILGKLPKRPTILNHQVQYLCALVSELTYYHVPDFEFDTSRRAMLLPSLGWQEIYRSRRITNLEIFLNSMDFEGRYFIVVERNVIAVGIVAPPYLFIGFRGTRFGFDWRINLKSKLVRSGDWSGKTHQGFATEAFRISLKIEEYIAQMNLWGSIENTFLTGHSLGGAVAALSLRHLNCPGGPEKVVIFGSPRYCDLASYGERSHNVPLQIRRKGDMVPSVPSLSSGYCDHPYQIDSHGGPVLDTYEHERWASLALKWTSFLGKAVAPHSMEGYREDIGSAAQASGSGLPLVPFNKLSRQDLT